MSNRGWIGVDLDGTLAEYNGWVDESHIGPPVPRMLQCVKGWLAMGLEVRIFTARVFPIYEVIHTPDDVHLTNALRPTDPPNRYLSAGKAALAIQNWCVEHLGAVLPITCVKDYAMVELYDDRAVRVTPNTGEWTK